MNSLYSGYNVIFAREAQTWQKVMVIGQRSNQSIAQKEGKWSHLPSKYHFILL